MYALADNVTDEIISREMPTLLDIYSYEKQKTTSRSTSYYGKWQTGREITWNHYTTGPDGIRFRRKFYVPATTLFQQLNTIIYIRYGLVIYFTI